MSAEIVTVDITTACQAAYRGRRRHPHADDRLAATVLAGIVLAVVVVAVIAGWWW